MRIRNFAHKGLKRLYSEDGAKGVPPDTAGKLRKMFAYLDSMDDPEELRTLAAWKVHTLTGDRKGTWSLSVTDNRRLTFRIDTAEREICDVNLEDYQNQRPSSFDGRTLTSGIMPTGVCRITRRQRHGGQDHEPGGAIGRHRGDATYAVWSTAEVVSTWLTCDSTGNSGRF